jgi:hypothetical protein
MHSAQTLHTYLKVQQAPKSQGAIEPKGLEAKTPSAKILDEQQAIKSQGAVRPGHTGLSAWHTSPRIPDGT